MGQTKQIAARDNQPETVPIPVKRLGECRLLALFGHGEMSELSPLSGEVRKQDFGAVRLPFRCGGQRVRAKSVMRCQ